MIFRFFLTLLLLFGIGLSGCFDLISSDPPPACGDQVACPFPRKCVNNQCLAQCIEHTDCSEGQTCESSYCVPRNQSQLTLPSQDGGNDGGSEEDSENDSSMMDPSPTGGNDN